MGLPLAYGPDSGVAWLGLPLELGVAGVAAGAPLDTGVGRGARRWTPMWGAGVFWRSVALLVPGCLF